MYSYTWDAETGGILLNSSPLRFSKEPRPVYYKELDILGFDKFWNYEKNDAYPYMWAESNNYYYRGRLVGKTKGGSLYTAPEIILIEDPEPDGAPLRFVDIPAMVDKNRNLLEKLTQDTIKKIYNTHVEYKDRVDVFYVAFSGGKDSVVTLDLVQSALTHNAFKVLFGDTGMEFPTTQTIVDKVSLECQQNDILFYEAKAEMSTEASWNVFGPPARRLRWCCTVHKTAPVINKLCDLYELDKIHSMMITGVRKDESSTRNNYDELSLGKKLSGQFSFHPILEWSSAEVYLYIFWHNLLLNDAYKYGFNRVGCIMCPNSSEKHEYIKRQCFTKEVDSYCEKIVNLSRKDLSGDNAHLFLETGGWKMRLSGRELCFSEDERYSFDETKHELIFTVPNLKPVWRTWYEAMGKIFDDREYLLLEFDGVVRKCVLTVQDNISVFSIENQEKTKNSIEFICLFKSVLVKSQYCIQCKACVAECPNRNIIMKNGNVFISNNCTRCHACLKMSNGCLYYNSIKGSKTMKSLKGINRYLSVGVDANWITSYLVNNTFEPGNRKTDVMFCLLTDASMTAKRKLTPFGLFIAKQNMAELFPWALMLCNLAYSPAFSWYIRNIPMFEPYIEDRLNLDMGDDVTIKAKGEFWNGFKTILDTTGAFNEIGLGSPDILCKENKNGEIKKKMLSITRTPWQNPDPRVILYSLYKFAEACGDYYQFTLRRLLAHDTDSDGVSPTEIFGLEQDQMRKLLNGLSVNYPDFITISFTLDLDNITLNSDKTSQDVLSLF